MLQCLLWVLQISIPKLCLKFTHLKSQPHLLGEPLIIQSISLGEVSYPVSIARDYWKRYLVVSMKESQLIYPTAKVLELWHICLGPLIYMMKIIPTQKTRNERTDSWPSNTPANQEPSIYEHELSNPNFRPMAEHPIFALTGCKTTIIDWKCDCALVCTSLKLPTISCTRERMGAT